MSTQHIVLVVCVIVGCALGFYAVREAAADARAWRRPIDWVAPGITLVAFLWFILVVINAATNLSIESQPWVRDSVVRELFDGPVILAGVAVGTILMAAYSVVYGGLAKYRRKLAEFWWAQQATRRKHVSAERRSREDETPR